MSNRFLAHLAMAMFAILIAASFSFGKLVTPFIAPAPLNAVRFILATSIIGFAAFVTRPGPIEMPVRPWRFGVFGALIATYFIAMFLALGITTPVATSAVFTLTPVLTAIYAAFLLAQRYSSVVIASLILAATGSIWVIFRGDLPALLAFELGEGELIFLIGALAYGFYSPLFSRWKGPEPILQQTFWTLLATTLWLLLIGAGEIIQTNWSELPPIVIGTIIYLAIFTTAATNFALQFASLHIPAAKVMAYVYLTPVIVILIEGVMGNGWVSDGVWAGALAIVLALLILYFSKDS